MHSNIFDSIKNQLNASMKMLEIAILNSNEEAWIFQNDSKENLYFWEICAHIIFFLDFYFSTFNKNLKNITENYLLPDFLHKYSKNRLSNLNTMINKEDMMSFYHHTKSKINHYFENDISSQFEDQSGFPWLEMTKLELIIYNIRHIMQHVDMLNQMLKKLGLPVSNWIK